VPAFDPRPFKATGITYCTSAMGADHTAGLVFKQEVSDEEAALLSQELQIINAVGDSTGFCVFLGPTLSETAEFMSPFFGERITAEQLADIGWDCLQDEWRFNEAAGFTAEDDDCAPCLREEGIGADGAAKFDVSRGVIAMAKVRQAPREELFNTSPAG
jgi:aldehyde:ferredoxin oxidoreductase